MNPQSEENADWIRLSIPLEQDSSGYPPATVETVWARRVSEQLYQIDNIPFFAQGLSVGDVLQVTQIDISFRCVDVKIYSGHSTLRVVVAEEEQENLPALRAKLESLGCSTELSHLPNLIAVDVPPTFSYEPIRRFLDEGEKRGCWEYEEASLHH